MYCLFWERERAHEQGKDTEREGERESQAGSMLSVQGPTQDSISGIHLRNCEIKTWAEIKSQILFFFLIFFLNVYLFLKEQEKQSMSLGGAERGGDPESEGGSRLWAVSTEPDTGLELRSYEIMTWAEVRCSTNWATQAPLGKISYRTQCLNWVFKYKQISPDK